MVCNWEWFTWPWWSVVGLAIDLSAVVAIAADALIGIKERKDVEARRSENQRYREAARSRAFSNMQRFLEEKRTPHLEEGLWAGLGPMADEQSDLLIKLREWRIIDLSRRRVIVWVSLLVIGLLFQLIGAWPCP